MSLLKWNQKKVQQLTPWEIWGFILGRGLVCFGLGVLAMQYYPTAANFFAIPSLVSGCIIFVIASKGFARKNVQ